MKKFGKLALAVCLSGALCFSLAGCYGPFHAARDAVNNVVTDVDHAVSSLFDNARNWYGDRRDDAQSRADKRDSAWDTISGKISGGLTGLSDIGAAIDREENPNDHRETFLHTGQNEANLRLRVKDASNVILRQGSEDDEYRMEYDPSSFRVDAVSKDGELTITVTQLRKPDQLSDGLWAKAYKCYLTLPARAYDSLRIQADGAGLYIDGLTSSFALDATDSGFSVSACEGGMKIDASDCGLSVTLPGDYAGGFTLSGKSSAFSLGFPDGEPENLLLRVDGRDNAITSPSGWGRLGRSWEHKNGNGSARVEVSVSESAGAISVGD